MEKITVKKDGIVFVSGMFNILHPGHFRFFNFSRNLGAKLVVGVLSDEMAPGASLGQQERLDNVRALSFVDEAVLLDAPVEKYLRALKPDIVVKGWEHHNQNNPEKSVLESYGGKLVFSSGEIKLSGFGVDEDKVKKSLKTIARPEGYMQRHNFTLSSLQNVMTKFSALKVCVLGDIIVDNYTNCQPIGMSREDPTIVVRPATSTFYLGGAGIVAAHAAGLGAQVHFISVTGNDDAGAYSREKLKEYGVTGHIFTDDSRPTTQKKRYRASGKTLLRVNEYSDHPISSSICQQITDKLQELLPNIDVIIFSDFSYGALPQELIEQITHLARNEKIVIAADSQTSSQIGNIARFKNVSLVTPTEHEARTAINNYADGLLKLAEKIAESTHAENVAITLAEEGLFIATSESGDMLHDRLPALQSAAVDPAGAGDALLVTTTMGLATGASIWQSVYLGSLASAVQVSRVGNIPLHHAELLDVLSE